MYDQFGEDADGLHDDSGGGGGMNPEDLFGSLFGGGGRRGGGQGAGGKRKGESIEKLLKVDLEDVYKGKTIKVRGGGEWAAGGRATACNFRLSE